jgi:hypothetical protein
MGNEIDANALRASNVKFSNGILKTMEQGAYIEYDEKGVGVRKPNYIASFIDDTKYKYPFVVEFKGKQPNGAKVDNNNSDSSYDFTKLSHAFIQCGDASKKNIVLFGCQNVTTDAENGKLDQISIFHAKDSKSSDVDVYMDKGDKLFDATRNVEFEAKGNAGYHQTGNKGYSIVTEVGVAGRIKSERHDDNGKVTTRYYAKDGKKLNERYALSTQRKTSDGYTITTFQNGKKSIVDKNGKALPVGTKIRILKGKDGKETVQIVKK